MRYTCKGGDVINKSLWKKQVLVLSSVPPSLSPVSRSPSPVVVHPAFPDEPGGFLLRRLPLPHRGHRHPQGPARRRQPRNRNLVRSNPSPSGPAPPEGGLQPIGLRVPSLFRSTVLCPPGGARITRTIISGCRWCVKIGGQFKSSNPGPRGMIFKLSN